MNKNNRICVGIGASAGGLEALRDFCAELKPGHQITYIVAQHLSPSHTSMMVDLLRRECRLDVCEAEDGVIPEASRIYVTPPNRDIELSAGHIRLTEARIGPGPKPNINRFFNSLAIDQGANSIGVILSGTGTDGATGMIQIKSEAGITMAQDPATAKYDGMPLACIQSDSADLVLPPADIARTIQKLEKNTLDSPSDADKIAEDTYSGIIAIVLRETGINLFHYKKNSTMRRIRRRMAICNIAKIEDYLTFLSDNQKEVHDLARDAFISVTSFFRDPKAFVTFNKHLETLLNNDTDNDNFRIWVPGCASGEEAYSIAILIEEHQRKHDLRINYRIFASDISEDPLKKARLGVYPDDALSDVSSSLIKRYFEETANGYSVIRRIRENVVFTSLDLIRDAPFSKLDLISCRNLLIYFDNELQSRVFDIFHYALKPSGLLFLGMSENIAQGEKLFSTLSSKHHVYAWQDVPGYRNRLPQVVSSIAKSNLPNRSSGNLKSLESIEERLFRLLSSRYAPATIVINQHNEVMFTSGELSGLTNLKAGPASLDLLILIRPELRAALKALVYKTRRQSNGEADKSACSVVPMEDGISYDIAAAPFDPNRPNWLLISFIKRQLPSEQDPLLGFEHNDEDEQILMTLEHELLSTRESLQTVVEELETSNEELQATNEELQSSNEEFQSTNEELQTTNEELQSSNEELLTLNDELQEKTLQYLELNSELENIQHSINSPLIVIDTNLRITRFVSTIDALVESNRVREQDHVTALPWRNEIIGLKGILTEVIKTHQSHRSIIQVADKVWQFQVTPFIDSDNRSRGAILVFFDTTELFKTKEDIRQEKEWSQITLNSIADGIIRTSIDGRIAYINPAASSYLRWTSHNPTGRNLEDVLVINTQEESEVVNLALYHLAGKELKSQGRNEHEHETDAEKSICQITDLDGNGKTISYSVSSTTDASGNEDGVVITFHDITERHESLSRMSWLSSHDDLTEVSNRREIERRIESLISGIKQGRKRIATFLFMDLDQFKIVNDTCGHAAGDVLLKQVSNLLHKHIRQRDTLGRLGGDEFGIILEDCPLSEAARIAEEIRSDVEQYKFPWNDRLFRIGISIGVVEVSASTSQISDVLSNADAACYAAKNQGRNQVYVHTDNDEDLEKQREERSWVTRIQESMENGHLTLHAQKICPLRDDNEPHWEVLLRMYGQQGDLILPGSFLPAAERFSLIKKLDMWVIDFLFSWLGRNYAANTFENMPRINVNLSGASFNDGKITEHVQTALKDNSVDPRKLIFEITESSAIVNFEAVTRFIDDVKKLGCKIALDDFGTGMSSFSYLQKLDVDFLKIDGSFVRNIDRNNYSQTIVKSIVDIAQSLDIQTVAEYAESAAVVDKLRSLNVDWVQGYEIGRPVSMDNMLTEFVAESFREEVSEA